MGSGSTGFRNRREAGERLARALAAAQLDDPVVLALPRGGVPVAAVVARVLGAPLDVLVVRKVGAPMQPELGVGAVGEGGVTVFNAELLHRLGLTEADMERTLARERSEVDRRVDTFRRGVEPAPVEGRTVVVVDDGLATGGTAEVAAAALSARGARRLVLAVPVGPPDTVARMRQVYADVVCLHQPPGFRAVGQYYDDFEQLSDADVAAELAGANGR